MKHSSRSPIGLSVEGAQDHRSRRPVSRPRPRRRMDHEYLAAVLDREVAAHATPPAPSLRIRAAGFGARKTIEEFDWDAQPAVRQQIASLASGGFLTEARNVVLLGPRHLQTHLATGLGIAVAHPGTWRCCDATDWVTWLTDAHRAGRLPLTRLRAATG